MNTQYLKLNEEYILEVISFSNQKNIEENLHQIQWVLYTDNGVEELIGKGKSIRYKLTEKYAGKKISFRAYIQKDSLVKYPLQKLYFFVEGESQKVFIKEVKGPTKTKIGETIECLVSKYDIEQSKVYAETKNSIKWDVKVGNAPKTILCVDNKNLIGEKISFKIPSSWEGKNVIIMPYLRSSTETVSINLTVGNIIRETKNESNIVTSKIVNFASNIESEPYRKNIVSKFTIETLENIAKLTGDKSITITSTIRTTRKQAEAMYTNRSKNKNVRYGAPGQQVNAVYNECVKNKNSKSETIDKMDKKIIELSNKGQRVSLHCVAEEAYKKLNVIDINHTTLVNQKKFIEELAKCTEVQKIIQPVNSSWTSINTKIKYDPEEPCIHFEIKVN